MSIVGKIIPKALKALICNVVAEAKTCNIIIKKYRHWESICKKKPLHKGNPIPWYTYPSIEFINQLNFSKEIVFEYGSGYSSLFWAKRCNKIISVEDNENWFRKMVNEKYNNQEIYLEQDENAYVSCIKRLDQKPTVVVIDGSHRLKCAQFVLETISRDTLIILDNSDWFPETCKLFRNNNYFQIDFSGIGPINPYTWTTSFFFTSAYKFSENPLRKLSPIGSLNQDCDQE